MITENQNMIQAVNNINYQVVPDNLFPLNEKEINIEWAKQTYNKSHLFSDHITGTAWRTETDLLEWMSIAKSLVKDIKWNGVKAGRDRIVYLAVHKYNLKLPQDSMDFSIDVLSPVNVNDVVEIVTNPKWYNERKQEKQAIIHELVYGITRKVHNFWLIEAEKKWMSRYNITYQNSDCQRITETRGFVYKLMNSTFSNTTIKLFKRAMISRLGEYIAVRDNARKSKKMTNNINDCSRMIQQDFPTGKGYIVQTNSIVDCSDNVSSEKVSVDHLQGWIKICINSGTSLNEVIDTVRIMYLNELRKTSHEEPNVAPKFSLGVNYAQKTKYNDEVTRKNVVTPSPKVTGKLKFIQIYDNLLYVYCELVDENNYCIKLSSLFKKYLMN